MMTTGQKSVLLEGTNTIGMVLILGAVFWVGSTMLQLEKETVLQGAQLEALTIQVTAVKESIVLASSDRYTKSMADRDNALVVHRINELERDMDSLKKWAKNAISARESRSKGE